MMRRRKMIAVCVPALLALATPARALLTTIGTADYNGGSYNLIYDSASPFGPIVWLDYTKDYENRANQAAWVASLDSALSNYRLNAGVTVNWGGGWRLPGTVDGAWGLGYDGTTTGGYNITSSEMGHLFYAALGNKGRYDTSGALQPAWGLSNVGDFRNLSADYYWSGTDFTGAAYYSWVFDTENGYQCAAFTGSPNALYALAVRPGQVESAPVPEPATLLLLGVGLAGLAGLRAGRRAR